MDELDRLSSHFRQAVMETIPCAVVVVDADGRIVYWNRSAADLTGFSAEEVLGSTCEVMRARLSGEQDPAMMGALCPFQSDVGDLREQLEIRRKDGRAVLVARRVRPVIDDAGERIGSVQAMVDVSAMRSAQDQIRTLKREMARSGRFEDLVGSSAAMRELYEAIEQVAPTTASVVIEGETGTGKELIARTIHKLSARASGPFLPVNCGALPENLLEAELFGHVEGAFTGAVRDRAGRFEQAGGGTLLLDEVGELSPASQVKLLRVLQEHEIVRVGESTPRPVDVRVVAATNRPLAELVAEGRFREDLYYRLRVVGLRVPPLRERYEDIPGLLEHFLRRFNRHYKRQIQGCTPQAMDLLERHRWPGNVRELEHALEHAFVVTAVGADLIEARALPPEVRAAGMPERAGPSPSPAVDAPSDERQAVLEALQQAGGSKAGAARRLGITRAGLYKRLKRLGMEA